MASDVIYFENPNTGARREAPVGFSITTLFFSFLPALLRGDWKGAGFIALAAIPIYYILNLFLGLGFDLYIFSSTRPISSQALHLSGTIFSTFYNRLYITSLVKKGFQAYGVDKGVLTEVVNELDSSIPILKKSQTNQNSQELLDNNQEHN